jgi:hypothetical protein
MCQHGRWEDACFQCAMAAQPHTRQPREAKGAHVTTCLLQGHHPPGSPYARECPASRAVAYTEQGATPCKDTGSVKRTPIIPAVYAAPREPVRDPRTSTERVRRHRMRQRDQAASQPRQPQTASKHARYRQRLTRRMSPAELRAYRRQERDRVQAWRHRRQAEKVRRRHRPQCGS